MEAKTFETFDLYLAAALTILLKQPPDYKVRNGKTLFVFPASDILYKTMNEYNNGVQVNALEFAQTIKRLRAEMLMRRGMGGNDNSRS